jgi:hypothetical protein
MTDETSGLTARAWALILLSIRNAHRDGRESSNTFELIDADLTILASNPTEWQFVRTLYSHSRNRNTSASTERIDSRLGELLLHYFAECITASVNPNSKSGSPSGRVGMATAHFGELSLKRKELLEREVVDAEGSPTIKSVLADKHLLQVLLDAIQHGEARLAENPTVEAVLSDLGMTPKPSATIRQLVIGNVLASMKLCRARTYNSRDATLDDWVAHQKPGWVLPNSSSIPAITDFFVQRIKATVSVSDDASQHKHQRCINDASVLTLLYVYNAVRADGDKIMLFRTGTESLVRACLGVVIDRGADGQPLPPKLVPFSYSLKDERDELVSYIRTQYDYLASHKLWGVTVGSDVNDLHSLRDLAGFLPTVDPKSELTVSSRALYYQAFSSLPPASRISTTPDVAMKLNQLLIENATLTRIRSRIAANEQTQSQLFADLQSAIEKNKLNGNNTAQILEDYAQKFIVRQIRNFIALYVDDVLRQARTRAEVVFGRPTPPVHYGRLLKAQALAKSISDAFQMVQSVESDVEAHRAEIGARFDECLDEDASGYGLLLATADGLASSGDRRSAVVVSENALQRAVAPPISALRDSVIAGEEASLLYSVLSRHIADENEDLRDAERRMGSLLSRITERPGDFGSQHPVTLWRVQAELVTLKCTDLWFQAHKTFFSPDNDLPASWTDLRKKLNVTRSVINRVREQAGDLGDSWRHILNADIVRDDCLLTMHTNQALTVLLGRLCDAHGNVASFSSTSLTAYDAASFTYLGDRMRESGFPEVHRVSAASYWAVIALSESQRLHNDQSDRNSKIVATLNDWIETLNRKSRAAVNGPAFEAWRMNLILNLFSSRVAPVLPSIES